MKEKTVPKVASQIKKLSAVKLPVLWRRYATDIEEAPSSGEITEEELAYGLAVLAMWQEEL